MIIGNVKKLDQPAPLENHSSTSVRHASILEPSAVFDPFFGIKVSSPVFSLDVFNNYCNGLRKTKLSSLASSSDVSDIVLMGVIVESTGIRRSSNDKDYIIWQLSDLMSDRRVKLLIFGDAVQANWKLKPGFAVMVTNPEMATDSRDSDQQQTSNILTLKIMKSFQLLSLGLCPDFGTCMSQRKNGDRCTNHVNVSVSPFCVYHIQTESRKLGPLRQSPSNSLNKQSNRWTPNSSVGSKHEGQLFTVQRPKNNYQHVDFFSGDRSSKAINFKRKAMSKLNELIEKESSAPSVPISTPKPPPDKSLCEFITKQTNLDRIRQAAAKVGPPQFGRSFQRDNVVDLPKEVQKRSTFSSAELAARKRAAEIFKRSQSNSPATKNQKLDSREPGARASSSAILPVQKFTEDQIRHMLSKKSSFEHGLIQLDREKELQYFQQKETEEKIETHATTLMEIKDVDVVTCKVCNYTTVHLASRCLDLGHEYLRHKATKRFFKCKDCKTRCVAYVKMPTQPCTKCLCRQFIRVSMKDERNIRERDPLLLRGEERKFVNS